MIALLLVLLLAVTISAGPVTKEAFPVPFSAGTLKHFQEIAEIPLPYGEPNDIVVTLAGNK